MSRSVLILLLLLALWIFLGLWFWRSFTDKTTTQSEPCVVSWELADGNAVIASSDATINFAKSSASIKDLDAELKSSINEIAKYLKTNNNKNITVVGYFDKDEKPATGTLRDLALARANVVKSMLTKNGVSPNQLAVVPMRYDDTKDNSDCLNGNLLNRGASFSFGKLKGSQ